MNYIKSLLAFDTGSMKTESVFRHIVLESKFNYFFLRQIKLLSLKL